MIVAGIEFWFDEERDLYYWIEPSTGERHEDELPHRIWALAREATE